jgi:CRP-like cAMP-binding protein
MKAGDGKLLYRQFLESTFAVTDREWDIFSDRCEEEPLARGEFFVREGKICRKLGFIVEGVMRYLRYEESGRETTCYFSRENDFVGDPDSFESQKPSAKNLVAITDCFLVTISFEAFGKLLAALPRFQEVKAGIDRRTTMALLQQRDFLINRTGASRYQWLVDHYPDIVQRVPLGHIASFLDITQQSLSRLRKRSS